MGQTHRLDLLNCREAGRGAHRSRTCARDSSLPRRHSCSAAVWGESSVRRTFP